MEIPDYDEMGSSGGQIMRLIPLVLTAIILFFPGPSFAQEWKDYVSRADFFSISFRGEPQVQDITYPTEYRITLPARTYTHVDGASRYSVTVVDYRNAVKMHEERVKSCRAKGGIADECQDDGPEEMRGAIVYASWNFMQRNAKLTHYAHYNSDVIEGHELHLTNPDGSRTFAVVHMHENRLYIVEATVPKGAPAPGLFQISLRFLDSEWNPVRYQWQGIQLYSNGYPPPPRARQGQGQPNQGQQGR